MQGEFMTCRGMTYYVSPINSSINYSIKPSSATISYMECVMKYFNIYYYSPTMVKVGKITRYYYPFEHPINPKKIDDDVMELLCIQMLLGYNNVCVKNIVSINGKWTLIPRKRLSKKLLGDMPSYVEDDIFDREIKSFISSHPIFELKYKHSLEYTLEIQLLCRRYNQFS